MPCINCFPDIFLDCNGDSTNLSTLRKISENDTEASACKLKYLLKFPEKVNGKWEHCFVSHPRFG